MVLHAPIRILAFGHDSEFPWKSPGVVDALTVYLLSVCGFFRL